MYMLIFTTASPRKPSMNYGERYVLFVFCEVRRYTNHGQEISCHIRQKLQIFL